MAGGLFPGFYLLLQIRADVKYGLYEFFRALHPFQGSAWLVHCAVQWGETSTKKLLRIATSLIAHVLACELQCIVPGQKNGIGLCRLEGSCKVVLGAPK